MKYVHSHKIMYCFNCSRNFLDNSVFFTYQHNNYCCEYCLFSFLFRNGVTKSTIVYVLEGDAE